MTFANDYWQPFLWGQTRVIYQWLRVEQLDQWWHWLLLAMVCLIVFGYIWYWYRRDSVEQTRPVGWALAVLRIAAFVGILLYFLQFDKRTERRIVRDSRVAILIDTSMSMSLPGTPSAAGVANSLSRAEEATRLVGQSEFLQQLAKQHQLTVYRFDQRPRPTALAALNKTPSEASKLMTGPTDASLEGSLQRGRRRMLAAAMVGALAAAMLLISLGAQIFGARNWLAGGWLLLFGSLLTLIGMVLLSYAIVPNTQYSLATLLGTEVAVLPTSEVADRDGKTQDVSATLPENWSEALTPQGSETHLGEAIKSILDREAGSPLAGIILLTDGRSNAGLAPKEVLAAARSAQVPLFVVGLGAQTRPPNLELVEIDVPRRLYPGDRFSLSALVGSSGYAGQQVTVQVLSGPTGTAPQQLSIEAEQQVTMPQDGSMATAEFQLNPKAVGEWQYAVQVIPLGEDAIERDNIKTAELQVVERKNRILIFAGGPTREYQFVRNLLYRDRDVESHVLLQTGTELTSQEAQRLLDEFPKDRVALSEYDAVLAFDADWTQVPDASVRALEQWVAEQAGGLLLIAGSVEMPKWLSRSSGGMKSKLLRSLSPVVLEQSGSALLAPGRVESETSWPLVLTTAGMQADFLWVTDDPKTSFEVWKDFEGVHSFYSAYELKPGGKSLLQFSDPTSALDGQLPIYLATQYYGAGRTMYLGGGELWRLRRVGDQYFDRLYTKLVRWISQGRLLLGSDRGVLLVDREQALLGDQVVLRAVLKNERYEPLIQSEVVARLVDPRGQNLPIVLRPLADGSQPGVYTGQFPILLPGNYLAQLQLGGLASNDVLTATVKAKVPAIEMQRAERNDPLLRQLAGESGGRFWTGVEAAVAPAASGAPDIIESIPPQDQVAYLPGAPDRVFQLRWLGWLMAWIAGCLSLEWVARRLHRLA